MAETQTQPSKYKPGTLAGIEVSDQPTFTDKELTDQEVIALKMLSTKAAQRDVPARLQEVISAWESRLFLRGMQFLIPQRGGGWIVPGESTGYGPSMQLDLALLPTNIYSAHSQIVISALTRSVPNVRFQPEDATKDAQITAADAAQKFVKIISRNNDLIVVQTDAARYLWTDNKALYWSRFVRDGQQFGWEEDDEPDDIVPEDQPNDQAIDQQLAAEENKEIATTEEPDKAVEAEGNPEGEEQAEEEEMDILAQRTPRGREVRTVYGSLEVKITPMMANDLTDTDVLQLEIEVDVSKAKAMLPDMADKIKGGSKGISEGQIAKLARQNTKLGMQSPYITASSIADDVTLQRNWIRRGYFMHVSDVAVRDSLLRKFPDGAYVFFAGETFCFARNESIDDCWAMMQAYSGDGQNRNALGTSLMPIQKRLNNWLDLMNDHFVRAIPKKWMDNKAFNVEAIRGQTNIPGDVGAFKRQPGVPVSELIFVEPAVNPPVNLSEFVKEYSGDLAELMSGAYPALAGGSTGSNDTATGIAIQRDQALGRLGPTWHQIKNAEAAAMLQGVKWGAKCRKNTINEKIPGGEVIKIEVNDLKSNILCYPESDENFPETYPQRQQRLMSIMDQSAKNPALAEIYNPANVEFMQRMVALTDLYIPQVASYKKQLGEIDILLKGEPVPSPLAMQAQQQIEQMKAQGVDPMMLQQAEAELASLPPDKALATSFPIDEIEDNETEAFACFQYLMSEEGRSARHNNPNGFQNVRLHFIAHRDAAAAKAGQAGPPTKVSLSASLKDTAAFDPNAGVQLLQKAGIAAKPGLPLAPPMPPIPAGPVQ